MGSPLMSGELMFLCIMSVWVLIALSMIVLRLNTILGVLRGEGDSILTKPLNSYGEGLGDAIQGQFVRGQRGIDQYDR